MVKRNRPDYRFMMKEINPFVNFNFGPRTILTPQKKGQISKYFNSLYGRDIKGGGFQSGLLSQPHINFRTPRNKKRAKLARTFSGAKGLTKLKIIPVPSPDKNAKIVFGKKNKNIKLKGKLVTKIIEFFNQLKLAVNEDKEIKRVLALHPRINSWQIMAGINQTPGTFSKKAVIGQIKFFTDKYDNHSKWLLGLIGFKFKNQKSLDDYLVKNSKNKKKIQANLKRLRRKGRS